MPLTRRARIEIGCVVGGLLAFVVGAWLTVNSLAPGFLQAARCKGPTSDSDPACVQPATPQTSLLYLGLALLFAGVMVAAGGVTARVVRAVEQRAVPR